MAFASAHFALGMACGGALAAGCIILRRGKGAGWLPIAMTLGGLWACAPDLPRIFRDCPSLPLSHSLGSHTLEQHLHRFGDLFFLHRALDRQPHEYAVLGLVAIILMYNLATPAVWLFRRPLRPRASAATPDELASTPLARSPQA
jgi:hypothetical protein